MVGRIRYFQPDLQGPDLSLINFLRTATWDSSMFVQPVFKENVKIVEMFFFRDSMRKLSLHGLEKIKIIKNLRKCKVPTKTYSKEYGSNKRVLNFKF